MTQSDPSQASIIASRNGYFDRLVSASEQYGGMVRPIVPRRSSDISNRQGLDHTNRGVGRYDPGKLEAGFVKERTVLWLGAFLAARDGKHDEVEHFARMRRVSACEYRFYDQQSAMRFHRATTVAKNSQALGFVPVVDDV